MNLKSNASSNEINSPFYQSNKELCEKWEKYILEKDGEIKGEYNAWSINLTAKISGKRNWTIHVTKATFSSGNLLISSKKQNLREVLKFKTTVKNTGCKDFCISQSIFKRQSRNHSFYNEVETLVRDGIKNNSLFEAQYKKSELCIVFLHKNEWFEMAEKLLEYDFNFDEENK